MSEHVHVFRLTRLRESEVPHHPHYTLAKPVFICIDCKLIYFAHPDLDKLNVHRESDY